ncbi:hypothetical protein [Facilibium subflavum]|uniref:hypothetical protein n=1 Tax=Facilibium subflavum TaxID=2219058 RepID=UPI0013C3510F|nr:hypothetical protein [Facilibium subflavum]
MNKDYGEKRVAVYGFQLTEKFNHTKIYNIAPSLLSDRQDYKNDMILWFKKLEKPHDFYVGCITKPTGSRHKITNSGEKINIEALGEQHEILFFTYDHEHSFGSYTAYQGSPKLSDLNHIVRKVTGSQANPFERIILKCDFDKYVNDYLSNITCIEYVEKEECDNYCTSFQEYSETEVIKKGVYNVSIKKNRGKALSLFRKNHNKFSIKGITGYNRQVTQEIVGSGSLDVTIIEDYKMLDFLHDFEKFSSKSVFQSFPRFVDMHEALKEFYKQLIRQT